MELFFNFVSVLMLSVARLTGCFITAPFFSEQVIPGVVRNVVIVSLAMVIVPLTMASAPPDQISTSLLILLIGKEAILGFSIGFFLSLVFYAAEGAGSFIDTQRGSSMAQALDPMTGAMSTTTGALLMRIIITLFFVSGGFLAFMGFMYSTFSIWPIYSAFPEFGKAIIPTFALQAMDGLMQNIVLIAAPISITMFLAEFGLGMINRFASQLNVFSLSMPIKSAIASFLMIIYLATLFVFFKEKLLEAINSLKVLKNVLS